MANRKLVAIITALMLTVGGQGAQAAYTLSHLAQMEQFILNGQWERLRAFLTANPNLLEGDSALAAQLRRFLLGTAGGTIATITPAAMPSLEALAAAKDSY
jgi:hypothetical protein